VRITDLTPLDVARGLIAEGLQVLPAALGSKAPKISWKKWQDRRADEMATRWFGGGQCNYWVMTGRMSGMIVIDCDTEAGHKFWVELIPDIDATTRVDTRLGRHHHWYKVPQDWIQSINSWAVHPIGVRAEDVTTDMVSFDVKADGGGVLVPPSTHPDTGLAYTWAVPLSDVREAPRELLDGSWYRHHSRSSAAHGGPSETPLESGGGSRAVSMLVKLLNNPPAEGGRNAWLTRVAGHYSRQHHTQHDLYELALLDANNRLRPPLDEGEFQKVADSIWTKDHEQPDGLAKVGEANGYLVGNGEILRLQIQEGRGDEAMLVLDQCTDFDMKAEGIMTSPEGWRTYWLTLIQRDQRTAELRYTDVVVKGEIFGDEKKLRAILSRYAATYAIPPNARPSHMGMGTRLQRYLEYQMPPVVTVTDVLGWDAEILDGDGGFVTHEHVITPEDVIPIERAGVRPDPMLMSGKLAPHKYGFREDWNEAQWVLNEVLTFHDSTVTSVFGAWWAACLLKPQLMERAALFPFMAIEAPSESGKTNGFFEMMIQLNGNWIGEQQPTKAAMRDMAAAHHSGIVWVDDLDDPMYLMELLRASTSAGNISKLGEDKRTLASVKIIAPLVLSGETLGMNSQKAMIDRAIPLQVGSPVGRKSRRDPERPQWDDILALRERYPVHGDRFGLADLAGWYVQAALSVRDEVLAALKRGKKHGSGRAADKDGILRAGACLLDYLCGHDSPFSGRGPHYARVDAWLARTGRHDGNSAENTLTLKILPFALRAFSWPQQAGIRSNEKLYGNIDVPVFAKPGQGPTEDETHLWFNPQGVADAFHLHVHGMVDKRTETYDALIAQTQALQCERKMWKLIGTGGRRLYYYRLPQELVDVVLLRSRGGD
jgi:hypothetical protein